MQLCISQTLSAFFGNPLLHWVPWQNVWIPLKLGGCIHWNLGGLRHRLHVNDHQKFEWDRIPTDPWKSCYTRAMRYSGVGGSVQWVMLEIGQWLSIKDPGHISLSSTKCLDPHQTKWRTILQGENGFPFFEMPPKKNRWIFSSRVTVILSWST